MKKNYLNYIGVIAFLLLAISCNDELADINVNPNATENPQPSYLLSATEYHSAEWYWGSTVSYNTSLLWVQHWAKIQYTEPDCYNVTNGDFNTIWNTGYATLIANLNAIINSNLSNDNYRGVASVWRSCLFTLNTLPCVTNQVNILG